MITLQGFSVFHECYSTVFRDVHFSILPFCSAQDLLPPARKREPIPPRELRVVVDTMLQGLGQHLRCCGVDVAILDDGDHARAAEVNHLPC